MCKLSDMWYWSLGNELGQKQGHRDHEDQDKESTVPGMSCTTERMQAPPPSELGERTQR